MTRLFTDPKVVRRTVWISVIVAIGLIVLSFGLPDALNYLLTNNRVVGWIAWISLFVTVGGFAFAWWQLIAVANATIAANNAVIQTSGMVRGHEQIDRINSAVNYLRDADRQILIDNNDAALAYLDIGWNTLVAARNLTKAAEDRNSLTDHLSEIVRMMEGIRAENPAQPVNPDSKQLRRASVYKILSDLGEMSSRLRLSLTGLGV